MHPGRSGTIAAKLFPAFSMIITYSAINDSSLFQLGGKYLSQ
jgi:hypothetical protein